MRLTREELKHVMNVDWGIRFWRGFRWLLLAVLALAPAGHLVGLVDISRPGGFVAGAIYLLVAWPGLCRVHVYGVLRRMIEADPEAREQPREAMNRRR